MASLAGKAFEAIQDQIATAALVPGQRLTERGLAEWLGMSPTPVREALRRLEQSGLVVKTSPRTVTVVEHSAQTLRELQYAEVVLRGAAARFAAHKSSPAQVERLHRVLAELEEAATGTDPERILAVAARFDELVVEVAANPIVSELARSAHVIGRRRRLHSVTVMIQGRRDVGWRHLKAHRDLVEAIAVHDGDRAEAVVRAHLQSSMDLLLSDLDAAG
jgi:DNA-binding GntR family transcriptional regulator